MYGENGKIGGERYELIDPEDRDVLVDTLLRGADRGAVAAFIQDAETEKVREPSVEIPD